MKKFKQIPESEWVLGDFQTFAVMEIGWKELEERLGAKYFNYRDADLGDSCGAFFKTDSGLQFMIEHRLEAPFPKPYANIYGLNRADTPIEPKFLADDLEEILEVAGIESSELTWKHETIQFRPHEVWRQDDNGNRFLIRKCPCRADAARLVAKMTARGHKQMYWMEPAT